MSQDQAIAYALGEKVAEQPRVSRPEAETEPARTKREREREVGTLISARKSNKEIAADLVISLRTAETHVEHILTKLGFTSRVQVATWSAQRHQE